MTDPAQSQRPLWQPSAQRAAATAMGKYRNEIAANLGQPDMTAADLHAWSVANAEQFWLTALRSAAQFADLPADLRYSVAQAEPPGATFFPGVTANYAQHLLAGGECAGAAEVAVIARREDGRRREYTWGELRAEVAAVAATLAELGVGPGDRVAAWLPNVPETLIAMLAANTLGAAFTSASPDFGVAGVLDRFAQVTPTVLIACDGYHYGGKTHARLALIADVAAGLPGLRAVILHRELGTTDQPRLPDDITVLEFPTAAATTVAAGAQTPAVAVTVPYATPGFILYSSGTTGRPKCIAHSALGLLVKHWTEHVLHCDIRPGDTVFYYTTCGWMMWNWLVTSLAWGATIVLYDGSPFAPDQHVLWDLAEAERVTLFGTSAKYLDASRKAGSRPASSHDLRALRTITSTGSPLSDDDFRYVYADVKADVHLASISGGTDICGCFVLGDPTQPVFAGEIQGPALGVAVDVVDSAGESLRGQPGTSGDLVCTAPMPSMPLGFIGDTSGERYRAAYFEQLPGVWTHGDFAHVTEHGGIVITGRSDATLNAGGVRIGTAEIYRQVERFDEVAEALAVGRSQDNDVAIVLFVRLANGAELTDELRQTIRQRLRTEASPRHVPAEIIAVSDLPRTRSGKIAELAVSDVINGREVRNTHALANPECLSQFDPQRLSP